MAITVSTTSPAESRFIIDLLRHTPSSIAFEVYLGGTKVAGRSYGFTQVDVTDTSRWPVSEPELR